MTDPKARLIAILTERPEYSSAYQMDAEFRSTVQSIANLLPLLLAVAYADSQQKAERTAKINLATSPSTERLMGGVGAGLGFPSAR